MIYGIGTDICDIRRIEATLARRGDRFPERVLGPARAAGLPRPPRPRPARGLRYLATRFSAKEAFSKAIGLGIRSPMTLARLRDPQPPSGKPYIRLHGELAALVRRARLAGARHRHRRNRLRGLLRRRRTRARPALNPPTMNAHPTTPLPSLAVVLDIAGTTLTQGRPPPPEAPAHRRADPVCAQLGTAPAHRADRRDQEAAARPADLRRPRRRPRAALPHRRLHRTCRPCACWASCG
jgi:holo-[acyl-carrier protein] synthase